MGTVPTGRMSGHHVPEIPGQLATVAVLDDTNNRMLAHQGLPHGEATTPDGWDTVLADLGYERISEWESFDVEGHRCDVQPVTATTVQGGGDDE